VNAADALSAIAPGSTIALTPGCSEPTELVAALCADSRRLAGSTVLSGLLLGSYPFLDEPFEYGTWHVMRPARGRSRFYPLRGSDLRGFLARRSIDVALVQLAPPDGNGLCSTGVSSSYTPDLIASAAQVIAEINPRMPRTRGTLIPFSDLDAVVEVDHPLVEYRERRPPETAAAIARSIEPLIHDGATVQTGIGGIPEAVLELLARGPLQNLECYGMASDAVVALAEAGKLRAGDDSVVAVELMGTQRLFDWADRNPALRMETFDAALDPARIAGHDEFVSINTAVEVDLSGAVNSESVGGAQISGIGGGFDFIEGARLSPDGLSIVALASTAGADRRSTIVPRLGDAPTSVPRHTVNVVVTEHGVADLRDLSLDERAEALIALAHPDHRDALREAL
jgi:acyl-CoA hydrolase